MKKGLIVLVMLLLVGGIGFTVKLNSLDEKGTPDKVASKQTDTSETSKSKLRAEYKKAPGLLTVSLYELSDEELYQRFGYTPDEGIDELFFDQDDTTKIVALKDGSMLTGKMVDNDRLVEVDSETDPNGLTVGEAKELLRSRQDELYQLYEAELTNLSE